MKDDACNLETCSLARTIHCFFPVAYSVRPHPTAVAMPTDLALGEIYYDKGNVVRWEYLLKRIHELLKAAVNNLLLASKN